MAYSLVFVLCIYYFVISFIYGYIISEWLYMVYATVKFIYTGHIIYDQYKHIFFLFFGQGHDNHWLYILKKSAYTSVLSSLI